MGRTIEDHKWLAENYELDLRFLADEIEWLRRIITDIEQDALDDDCWDIRDTVISCEKVLKEAEERCHILAELHEKELNEYAESKGWV